MIETINEDKEKIRKDYDTICEKLGDDFKFEFADFKRFSIAA